jgi:Uma2 family endonuclease
VLFDSAVTLKDLGWVVTAPMEVKFPGDNAVEPDLVVVLRDRAHIIGERRIEGVPNALLEILSPSTRNYDRNAKATLYARNGVSEYWIVDLDAETITVFALRDGVYYPLPNDGIARSRVVPDLAVDVAALFKAAKIQSF